jgi:two-component system response regulator GlrR
MVRVGEALRRAAVTDVRMVLYGETGVGKTYAANVLHALGPRAERPLLQLNLVDPRAAERLADAAYLASAEGGTLLLEGVDQAASELQALLLGVVDRWSAPDGDAEAPIRMVATGARDLLVGVEQGWFRKDLYYLLDVFPIALPPLRERVEEIPTYLEHFIRRHAPGRRLPSVPDEFMAAALAYPWPGNLRELESVLLSALPQREGSPWRFPAALPRRGGEPNPLPFAQAKRDFEQAYVHRLLILTEGNVTRAAELAGKARKDFYALMARNRVDPEQFRGGVSE